MTDTITRRSYLLAAIQREPSPICTQRAAQLLAASPWPTAGRNTARKDLRALAAAGALCPDSGPYRVYHPKTSKDNG